MADHRNIDARQTLTARGRPGAPIPAVNRLTAMPSGPDALDVSVAACLLDITLHATETYADDWYDAMARYGLCDNEVAEYYIPHIARELGDGWLSDEIGFADVTLGAARLQSILRRQWSAWASPADVATAAPSVMVLAARPAQHTLGSIVLAGHLRRKGCDVCLLLGPELADVIASLDHTDCKAVFITAAQTENLEPIREIVRYIKKNSKTAIPVVVGGPILIGSSKFKIIAATGADDATSRPDEALRICGLETKCNGSITLMQRA